ncbi:glycosyltransferase [Temperatibacter marinus]|uniref:Glycosyltransferase n=1 Tax=Temperatibacter marinus TaxID=1456591 RepID=A0AA52EEK1_9PROT|nr:glycosyltransferase [Temperatibacter marinus]WND03270.1 glycosyltransferase [Temperatibacter marinus]
MQPICSILIPACNEEAVIQSTLHSLLLDAKPNEFDIIVLCNGCFDRTADLAREVHKDISVVEINKPSKTNALNIGISHTKTENIVFLDADIKVTAKSVRTLIKNLEQSQTHLAFGRAVFIVDQASYLVRSFYKAWHLNPYFDEGKIGGYFALSKAGIDRLGTFPEITNDDEFVKRKLTSRSYEPQAAYYIDTPRTFPSLLNVRSRVYKGNQELETANAQGFQPKLGSAKKRHNALLFMKRIIKNPQTWIGALIFALSVILVRLRTKIQRQSMIWEKDHTTRKSISIE